MGEKRDAEGVAKVTRSPPSTVSAPGSVIIRKRGERPQAERWITLLAWQRKPQTGHNCSALVAERLGEKGREREHE